LNTDAYVSIRDLAQHDGRNVALRGWLCGKRSGGKIVFLQMRDGTGICQGVVEASCAEAFRTATAAPLEASVTLTGLVRRDERSPGGYEIAVSSLTVIQAADDYPIARKAHGIDFLMQHRHLWLRSRRPATILRIRHTLVRACREFFDGRGFTLVDTPILVPGAGEDRQTLFPVDYFGERAFLAQTGQLYLESACMALGKVYCFGPTFRAEKSKTRRHLAEFWMIEPEVAFAELEDIIALAEDMLCHVVQAVLACHAEDLALLGRDLAPLRRVEKPFPRITYDEAVRVLRSAPTRQRLEAEMTRNRARLQEHANELASAESRLAATAQPARQEALRARLSDLREIIADLEHDLSHAPEHMRLAQSFVWGSDLGGSAETMLSRQFDQPLFVTHYPREVKAFYMQPSAANPQVVRNMDLLAPEGYGEIIGGSQREDNLQALVAAMQAKGLNPDDYGWYLDLRRYGSVPHGGFGLGVERTLAWICGLPHVREAIPFPRTLGRLHP
jgi:asparaginyl-tRNA synthetase